jgi:hypothetical protein
MYAKVDPYIVAVLIRALTRVDLLRLDLGVAVGGCLL